eukprot:Opistho-2@13609
MAMRSPRKSASSMWCVDSRIVRPSLWRMSRSHIARRLLTSTPADASSHIITLDPPTRARPTDSLRFIPPESVWAFALILSERWRSSMICRHSASTRSLSTPLKPQKSWQCSMTVRDSSRQLYCGTKPRLWRMLSMPSRMLAPFTNASPDDGGKRPVSMDMVVVLPAPLCPSSAVIWPRYIFSERSSTATLPLSYTFPRCDRRIPASSPLGSASKSDAPPPRTLSSDGTSFASDVALASPLLSSVIANVPSRPSSAATSSSVPRRRSPPSSSSPLSGACFPRVLPLRCASERTAPFTLRATPAN